MPETSSITFSASSVSRQSLFVEKRSSQTTTSSTAYNKVGGHGAEYNNCMRCRCRQGKEKKWKGHTYTCPMSYTFKVTWWFWDVG